MSLSMPYSLVYRCPKESQMIAQVAQFSRIFALAITVLGLAAGCATQTPAAAPAKDGPERAMDPGARAASIALDQVGSPYRFGGSSPAGFDCSGLVQYAWRHAGQALPRTTTQLWNATRPISRRELRKGDLVFFRIEGKMSHVGLYIGGQRFVHAPSSGRTVSVESLESDFYRAAFIRGGRPEHSRR